MVKLTTECSAKQDDVISDQRHIEQLNQCKPKTEVQRGRRKTERELGGGGGGAGAGGGDGRRGGG